MHICNRIDKYYYYNCAIYNIFYIFEKSIFQIKNYLYLNNFQLSLLNFQLFYAFIKKKSKILKFKKRYLYFE